MKKLFGPVLFGICLFSLSANAKRFASKYTEFELPPGWECALEGSEYVCQSTNKQRQKEAIIILAAKTRGEKDNLAEYQAYLQTTKTYALPGGKTQVSEAKYTRKKSIRDHIWIDSLHLASEVPGFYTRYLATVKERLGVAVTFSVSKEHYESYQEVFDKVVETLRVFQPVSGSAGSDLVLKKSDESLFDSSMIIPGEGGNVDIGQSQRSKGAANAAKKDNIFFILILLAVIIGFIIIKKRKKK